MYQSLSKKSAKSPVLNTLAMFWGLSTIIIMASKGILLLTSDISAKNNVDPKQPYDQLENGVAYEKRVTWDYTEKCLCSNIHCVNSLIK